MTEQQNQKYQEYVPDYEIIFAGYKKKKTEITASLYRLSMRAKEFILFSIE